MKFFKYHGAGNDFVMVDNREGHFPKNDEKYIHTLCHRHLGVGADGLILLEDDEDNEFKMIYYNADGREGTMCGNGGRCIVAFAADLGVIVGEECVFSAVDGVHHAVLTGDRVKLSMRSVTEVEPAGEDYILDTGSPHFVRVVNNLNEVDVYEEGFAVRHTKRFNEEGTNVNFVQALASRIEVGTYERGVEDVTMSCGTGVVAAALAMHRYDAVEHQSPQVVVTAGGMLKVYYEVSDDGYEKIYLEGPATKVYQGEYFPD